MTTPHRIIALSAAIRYRKAPDTPVPTSPVAVCSEDPALRTWPFSDRRPTANRSASTNTIVECPSEKNSPTLSGRLPSAISLRVVLSIAEMWSASNAWRMPSVYAVKPVPTANTLEPPRRYRCGATRANSRPKPSRCRPSTTALMSAIVRHWPRSSEPRMRCRWRRLSPSPSRPAPARVRGLAWAAFPGGPPPRASRARP